MRTVPFASAAPRRVALLALLSAFASACAVEVVSGPGVASRESPDPSGEAAGVGGAPSGASCSSPPASVPVGQCACYGGEMDASWCAQLGWFWNGDACLSGADPGGALCSAAQAKHSGDGSGSDVYNLGVCCQAQL